jgi:hypothetical protein
MASHFLHFVVLSKVICSRSVLGTSWTTISCTTTSLIPQHAKLSKHTIILMTFGCTTSSLATKSGMIQSTFTVCWLVLAGILLAKQSLSMLTTGMESLLGRNCAGTLITMAPRHCVWKFWKKPSVPPISPTKQADWPCISISSLLHSMNWKFLVLRIILMPRRNAL